MNLKQKKDLNLYYVCFTEYDKTIPNVNIAFKPKKKLVNTFWRIYK